MMFEEVAAYLVLAPVAAVALIASWGAWSLRRHAPAGIRVVKDRRVSD